MSFSLVAIPTVVKEAAYQVDPTVSVILFGAW